MDSRRLIVYLVRALVVVSGAALGFLSFSCAKKGFPEGGPLDKTPPTVVSTIPASGEVGVARTAEIQIEFSEPIERTTLLPNLFVSPPLRGNPAAQWSKWTVRLSWNDTLRPDITYRVTLGAKIADQRKNLLKEAITLAFSTGAKIDSGHIEGQIWTGPSAATGLEVFAYRLDSAATWSPVHDTLGGTAPEFVSQTGAEGTFDLPYLPSARFRVLAIGDRNRNRLPDPNEVIGIPDRDVDLSSPSESQPLRIFTQVFDTAAFVIKSCSPAEDGSVLIGLSHPADTAYWTGSPLIATDSATGETLSISILRPVPPRFTVVPVISEQFESGRTYRIKSALPANLLEGVRDSRGESMQPSECVLTYPDIPDTSGPRVAWTVLPDAKNALSPRSPVLIGFSEPVDTGGASQLLRIYDSVGTVIEGVADWPDLREMSFTPAESWPETTGVVVTLDSALLRDRHGNSAPSQTWTWTFAPLTESAMGALSCRIQAEKSEWAGRRFRIEARPQGRDALVSMDALADEPFELPLPAGPWLLSAFIDLDENGRFSPGRLMPYQAAEPRAALPDTVSVRARFTREDVVIRF